MLAATFRAARPAARSYAPPNRGFARLTLVGYLGAEPEIKKTKNDREYASYKIATRGDPPPPAPDGTRSEPVTSWHRVYAFSPNQVSRLATMSTGTLVYVEAEYELREPLADAEPGSPEAQRQVFLRQEKMKVLKRSPRERVEEQDQEQ